MVDFKTILKETHFEVIDCSSGTGVPAFASSLYLIVVDPNDNVTFINGLETRVETWPPDVFYIIKPENLNLGTFTKGIYTITIVLNSTTRISKHYLFDSELMGKIRSLLPVISKLEDVFNLIQGNHVYDKDIYLMYHIYNIYNALLSYSNNDPSDLDPKEINKAYNLLIRLLDGVGKK